MKRVWNEEKDNLLRRHYPKRDLDWVAQRIGVSRGAVKARAQVLGIQRKVHKREPWTDRQLAYLRKHYADMRAEDITEGGDNQGGNQGSGTTAIACIKERRHFIGFELSKEYFDKAVRRIKAEQAQLTLF